MKPKSKMVIARSRPRNLVEDYSGPAIRVRRSNDNAEIDFGFTSDNLVDVEAINKFLNGGVGFVVKDYDQTKNLDHAVQKIASKQEPINVDHLEQLAVKCRLAAKAKLKEKNA